MASHEPHLSKYLLNVVRAASACDETARGLSNYVEEHGDDLEAWLGEEAPKGLMRSIYPEFEEQIGGLRAHKRHRARVRRQRNAELMRQLEEWLVAITDNTDELKPVIPEPVAWTFGLYGLPGQIISLLLASRNRSGLKSLLEALQSEHDDALKVLSVCIDETKDLVGIATTGQRGLVSAGLVTWEDRDDRWHTNWPVQLSTCWSRLRGVKRGFKEDVLSAVLGDAEVAERSLRDFEHIGMRNIARDLLEGAIQNQAVGVNILLYGPPGNGKTELARVLAKAAGSQCFSIGKYDEDSRPPSRHDRISQLRVCGRLLGPARAGVILFDEMEDIIADSRRGSLGELSLDSKGFWTQTLEHNPVPVIWTANSLEGFGDYFLRRMSLIVQMGKPPLKVRASVCRSRAREAGLELSRQQATDFAKKCNASPGLVSKAFETAAIAGGTVDDAVNFIRMAEAAMTGRELPPSRDDEQQTKFDISLINSTIDLVPVLNAMKEQQALDVSFLLTGAPGTGKSALAQNMADELNMELIQKRASDILGMFVGQSEKNVAEAFKEAKDRGAFLFFDEVDSLLRSRAGAQHRFEVGLVNEMLTWLQDHPLPVACATNFSSSLDEASLRRFTFSVELRPMTACQAKVAWGLYFPKSSAENVTLPSGLVPSDFASARKRMRFQASMSPEECVRAVTLSRQARTANEARPIGFRQPA